MAETLQEDVKYEILAAGTLTIGSDQNQTNLPLQVEYSSSTDTVNNKEITTQHFRAGLQPGASASLSAQSLIDAGFEFLRTLPVVQNQSVIPDSTPQLPLGLDELTVVFDVFQTEGDIVTGPNDNDPQIRDPTTHVESVYLRARAADDATWELFGGFSLSKLSVELLYTSLLDNSDTVPADEKEEAKPVLNYKVVCTTGMYIRDAAKTGKPIGVVPHEAVVTFVEVAKDDSDPPKEIMTRVGRTKAPWYQVKWTKALNQQTWKDSEKDLVEGYMWSGYLRYLHVKG